MKAVLAATIGMLLATRALAGDPVLSFPSGAGTARLKLAVTVDGKSPDGDWTKFLDAFFDHFDRDGDGVLSTAEAARVFPLPLAKDQHVALDFAKLDTNRDDTASRAEFHAYYRAVGFAAVVVTVPPAAPDVLALGNALFEHVDRDGDGTLSAVELQGTARLVRRLDEDEDEVLTAAELTSNTRPNPLPLGGLKIATPGEKRSPQGVLQLPLGGTPTLVETPKFALAAAAARLAVPGGSCTLELATDAAAVGFRAAKGFYLAQFKAAGSQPVAKAVFADDPTAQVLANLFDPADRDGDGKLALAELEAFFALVERGVTARVVVTVEDRGRNLFDLADANRDGRLDGAELRALASRPPLERSTVPASYRLAVRRGTVGDRFGPFPLGSIATPKAVAKTEPAGPRWFRSMDRNSDGFVSGMEFPGSPARFRELDADADGRISEVEARTGKR